MKNNKLYLLICSSKQILFSRTEVKKMSFWIIKVADPQPRVLTKFKFPLTFY